MTDGSGLRFLPVLVLVLAAAAAISAALILALRPTLRRYAMARPNARSSHKVPTPQGGGIAVVIATVSVATCALLIANANLADTDLTSLWVVLAATALMAVIGAVDDIRTIEVAPRLLLQAVLVGVVIAMLPAQWRVIDALPWWVERALLLFGGLWFVNLVNFMDGLDWMTVAEVVPVTAALVILGITGSLPLDAIVLAAALAGAMIGFAPFNRPVATLFLGDVGSLPIGLMLGWLLAVLASRGHFAAAVLLPLYYLADATVTLLLRTVRGKRLWEAHRTHYYQRATENGWSVRRVVSCVFAVNVALAGLAAVTVVAPERLTNTIALLAGAALVGGLLSAFARARR
jgi:UDP-N-acetylmuramyl pentapeptide phosphotransferase/UDP-N-acetylglucosamine-1-phosphate transferase